MRIAIHNWKDDFTFRWIEHCKRNSIEYKLVNAYDSDIISQVDGCDIFMWHHLHYDYRDKLFANQLIYSMEKKGLKVFPNFNTTWHFDDKVGQKYLLEAIGAPLVPSYTFYTKKDAYEWIKKASFPKVFKLRGGAGSSNVKLAHTKSEAKTLVRQAFGRGFTQFDRINYLKERFRKWQEGKDTFTGVMKGVGRLFFPTTLAKMRPREKGYAYFQDFIPNNTYDIRIVVIGNKAFALKRLTREGDFRASGSGFLIYDKNQIDERCVRIAFDVNQKLKMQSAAFDFVFKEKNEPLIVEISYCYKATGYDDCEGYWTSDMEWHEGSHFDFCGWMVEDCIKARMEL